MVLRYGGLMLPQIRRGVEKLTRVVEQLTGR
jgi:hypothetical protein